MEKWNCETERLLIEPLQVSDAAFVLELMNTPDWLRYIGDRNVRNLEEAVTYLKNGPLDVYREFNFGILRVSQKESNEPIGICGFLKRPFLDAPDLGFGFLPRYFGKGYGTEAAMCLMEKARIFGLSDKVYAFANKENHISEKLLLKLGFSYQKDINPYHPGEYLKLFEVQL